nr:cell division protein FtsH [Lachnospiraceae bacterium]
SEEAGMIHYGGEDSVFIGRDYGHTREYGENTASLLDNEVRRIMKESYDKAKDIIVENQDVLEAVAEKLVVEEKMGQQEFEEIFNNITSSRENHS